MRKTLRPGPFALQELQPNLTPGFVQCANVIKRGVTDARLVHFLGIYFHHCCGQVQPKYQDPTRPDMGGTIGGDGDDGSLGWIHSHAGSDRKNKSYQHVLHEDASNFDPLGLQCAVARRWFPQPLADFSPPSVRVPYTKRCEHHLSQARLKCLGSQPFFTDSQPLLRHWPVGVAAGRSHSAVLAMVLGPARSTELQLELAQGNIPRRLSFRAGRSMSKLFPHNSQTRHTVTAQYQHSSGTVSAHHQHGINTVSTQYQRSVRY